MYKLIEGGVRHPDGFAIPENANNRDWQVYLAWLAAGNQAEPADGPDIEALRAAALAALEEGIYAVALAITGEPSIDALKIAEWQVKEATAQAWDAAGRPEPAKDNEFGWVIGEAEQYMADPASGIGSPGDLIAAWGANAAAWRQLQQMVIPAFRKAQKNAAAGADEETLAGMTAGYFKGALLALAV